MLNEHLLPYLVFLVSFKSRKVIFYMTIKMLRLRAVQDWTGLSRSTIYAMMKNGEFPKNIALGARAVGWTSDSIEAWIDSRISATQVA